MLKKRLEKTYQKFPYRADFENGRTNIGGINLTKEPERIDEIAELANLPRAKQAVYQLNAQNTAFMTLGCAFGELFFEYLSKKHNQEMIDYMERALMSWEVHFSTVDGSVPQPIVAIFVGARSFHDLDLTVELLIQRLHQDFLYLVS